MNKKVIKDDIVDDGLPHFIGTRFEQARMRAGISRSALAKKVHARGGQLTDLQIKRLEEGVKAQVSLPDLNLAMTLMGVHPGYIFTTVVDENNLLGHTTRCFAEIIKSRDDFAAMQVLRGALLHTDHHTRDFDYELHVSY